MSLKKILYHEIKVNGVMGIAGLRRIAEIARYNQSNAERRLREMSNAGLIQRITNAEGVVTGYRLKNGSKMPPVEKKVSNSTMTQFNQKQSPQPSQAFTDEYKALSQEAKKLFLKVNFGSKDYLAAVKMFKKNLSAKTQADKLLIMRNIVFLLKK